MYSKDLYSFRQDIDKWLLLEGKMQNYIAEQIGISTNYISDIVTGKKDCSKCIAYALTKCVNKDKNIEDLFIRKEK